VQPHGKERLKNLANQDRDNYDANQRIRYAVLRNRPKKPSKGFPVRGPHEIPPGAP